MQGQLVLPLKETGAFKKKALDHLYARMVCQPDLIALPLINGGLLSGRMVTETPMIQIMKENSAPRQAIIMEAMTLVNMEIIWGLDILGIIVQRNQQQPLQEVSTSSYF